MNLYLTNGTGQALDLATVDVRYYFTDEPPVDSHANLEFAAKSEGSLYEVLTASDAGSSLVQVAVASMSAPATGADSFLRVTFASNMGTLAPGGEIEIGLSIHVDGYAYDYKETDDYSFTACGDTRVLDPRVVVLGGNGTVLFGQPPG